MEFNNMVHIISGRLDTAIFPIYWLVRSNNATNKYETISAYINAMRPCPDVDKIHKIRKNGNS